MSEEPPLTELQRALLHKNADELRTEVAEYYKWYRWYQEGQDQNASDEGRGKPADSLYWGREGALAMCAFAMAEYDDRSFLGSMAAGALEDALDTHPWDEPVSDEFLARIVTEAGRTPRFRWMLSGVWDYSFEPHVAKAVFNAVGDTKLEDPLPPRPLA